jgi:O-antigen ligase
LPDPGHARVILIEFLAPDPRPVCRISVLFILDRLPSGMTSPLRALTIDTAWPAGILFALLASAWFAPGIFWLLLPAAAASGLAVLAWRHLTEFCVVWLLLAGLTLEMTLRDLVDPAVFSTTIAAMKAAQIGLGILCALRYGPRLDPLNPAWVFGLIFGLGLLHGLHPGLTLADSLRSLAGSVAPFAFCFSRLPPSWATALLRAALWIPLLSFAGGSALDLAGLRPLFVDSGGARLAGLGHPAYLGAVCLTAIYAGLIRLHRHGGHGDLLLLGVNFLLLVLTGARAPLAYAVIVTVFTLACTDSPALPARRRWLLLLGAAVLLPPLAVLAESFTTMRLFQLLGTDSTNLSGRELLWPPFEQAAAQSSWLGWGLGAGNFIIPPDSELARTLQTWAAHNEYLRIEVEGGQIGRVLRIGSFTLWVLRHTRALPRDERRIMRLIFLAVAGHAATDNVLISSPACVFFSVVAAVFVGRSSDGRGEGSGRTETWSRGSRHR